TEDLRPLSKAGNQGQIKTTVGTSEVVVIPLNDSGFRKVPANPFAGLHVFATDIVGFADVVDAGSEVDVCKGSGNSDEQYEGKENARPTAAVARPQVAIQIGRKRKQDERQETIRHTGWWPLENKDDLSESNCAEEQERPAKILA